MVEMVNASKAGVAKARAVAALLAAALAGCTLAGCASGGQQSGDADASADAQAAGAAAMEGVNDVAAAGDQPVPATGSQTVIFPSSYFSDVPSSQQAIERLESLGCTNIEEVGDGSFSATMDAAAYNQLVASLYGQVQQAIATLEQGSEYPNVQKVSYDEGFAHVQVQLSTDMPGIEDTFALAVVGVPAATYQQVAGLPVGCEASLVLASGTVQQTDSFPMYRME